MMLLEHDAKMLLEKHGVACPHGWATEVPVFDAPFATVGPWAVKAQVPVGGRGKAGGIRIVRSEQDAVHALRDILGMAIKGNAVRSCRIEEAVSGSEMYLALRLAPARGEICCLFSATGGVDIEDQSSALKSCYAAYDKAAVIGAMAALVADLPQTQRRALEEAIPAVAGAFFALEATLVEINPLMVRDDGRWTAADAKVVLDLNALPRQPDVNRLIKENPRAYPEAAVKLERGFDYVVIDPNGEIGLITTGAGLSMQVADEIAARGHSVFNFCDMRTGGFRGSPDRLIYVLRNIAEGPHIKAAFINIFAGITHLGEFAAVLVEALKAVPEFRAPLVARLIGNGEDEGTALLRASGVPMTFERDLDRALDKVLALAAGAEAC